MIGLDFIVVPLAGGLDRLIAHGDEAKHIAGVLVKGTPIGHGAGKIGYLHLGPDFINLEILGRFMNIKHDATVDARLGPSLYF